MTEEFDALLKRYDQDNIDAINAEGDRRKRESEAAWGRVHVAGTQVQTALFAVFIASLIGLVAGLPPVVVMIAVGVLVVGVSAVGARRMRRLEREVPKFGPWPPTPSFEQWCRANGYRVVHYVGYGEMIRVEQSKVEA